MAAPGRLAVDFVPRWGPLADRGVRLCVVVSAAAWVFGGALRGALLFDDQVAVSGNRDVTVRALLPAPSLW